MKLSGERDCIMPQDCKNLIHKCARTNSLNPTCLNYFLWLMDFCKMFYSLIKTKEVVLELENCLRFDGSFIIKFYL